MRRTYESVRTLRAPFLASRLLYEEHLIGVKCRLGGRVSVRVGKESRENKDKQGRAGQGSIG
jgi:hypothetical protein